MTDDDVRVAPSEPTTRRETDSLGSRDVPTDAYWGIHTLRAVENFPVANRPISVYPELVVALAVVKQAAARANVEIGVLDPVKARAIEQACDEIRGGALHDEFRVGVMQGGAGTSTNMNSNEVIANRALEILGHARGEYEFLHPIDDVNRSQSTNDTYPTAIKLAMILALGPFVDELGRTADEFAAKGTEFRNVLKVGRTQLQDAVPMTLGQEFTGFAHTLGEDQERLRDTLPLLAEINLGATAIGTGITADPKYAEAVRRHLSELTGIEMVTAPDLIEATSDAGVYMTVSGALKRSAIKLSKICNDLRLLSSGPQAGLGEITLPPRQAGSSIMPGKVNPVIPEVVNQVAFAVAGADVTVTMAAEAGQLQLNAFEPVIANSILQSVSWLSRACRTLRVNCIDGIQANTSRLAQQVETNIGVVTALTPYIGYAAAASIAHTALATETPIATLVVAAGLMTAEQVEHVLSPARLSGLEAITSSIPVVTAEQITKHLASLDAAHADETTG
ncbi:MULTISPECIES: aspartate ammonia-lyase [unclassified Frondihabitans]|uniref:aspartate ammonia-lyase n=1 Tax=unclassified Frondihabitans TaxID=2626248 RepID=UPI000F4DF661|nr:MULTISPECIES: aspartate ammonia-lyase [unclassified Frondihabitans]RPE76570.1 aspartate ammonia-lyase [Frondihabitans sp. PhB153]RPF05155.1 aspartate ammonia-lyase [Frondihabitans sp. PhB161]